MQASNFNIKSEKTANVFAIDLGILCGCFHGSYFRNSNKESTDSQSKLFFRKFTAHRTIFEKSDDQRNCIVVSSR